MSMSMKTYADAWLRRCRCRATRIRRRHGANGKITPNRSSASCRRSSPHGVASNHFGSSRISEAVPMTLDDLRVASRDQFAQFTAIEAAVGAVSRGGAGCLFFYVGTHVGSYGLRYLLQHSR